MQVLLNCSVSHLWTKYLLSIRTARRVVIFTYQHYYSSTFLRSYISLLLYVEKNLLNIRVYEIQFAFIIYMQLQYL